MSGADGEGGQCYSDRVRRRRGQVRGNFSSLEALVSQREDRGDYASTAALGEWIEQRDHIQKSEEESLHHQNNASSPNTLPNPPQMSRADTLIGPSTA